MTDPIEVILSSVTPFLSVVHLNIVVGPPGVIVWRKGGGAVQVAIKGVIGRREVVSVCCHGCGAELPKICTCVHACVLCVRVSCCEGNVRRAKLPQSRPAEPTHRNTLGSSRIFWLSCLSTDGFVSKCMVQ